MPSFQVRHCASHVMTQSTNTEQRLTDLEIKIAYADDLLDQLNQTIFRQQQQIERLAREMEALRRQMPEGNAPFQSLRDELPPHY
jgi:SlyX protein